MSPAGRSGRYVSGKLIGAVRVGLQADLRPRVTRPRRRAAGHLDGRNGVDDPRSGLTRRWTGWFRLLAELLQDWAMLTIMLVLLGVLVAVAGVGLVLWQWFRATPATASERVFVTPPSAQHWQPLQDALVHHVRAPLQEIPDVNERWRQAPRGEYPLDPHRGQVSVDADRLRVLSHALLYSCMHFDSLCTLMDTQVFRDHVLSALPSSDDRPVLHVDLGCGPGTASWSVMNVMSDDACVTSIGYDHNRQMAELAQAMTSQVADALTRAKPIDLEFHHDWTGFEQRAMLLSGRRWASVIVTANSVFGADTMTAEAVEAIKVLIEGIQGRARGSDVFVVGTHPQYSVGRVRNAWDRIAAIPADELYGESLNITSGSPRRYYEPTWVNFTPKPQMADILRVAGSGGCE